MINYCDFRRELDVELSFHSARGSSKRLACLERHGKANDNAPFAADVKSQTSKAFHGKNEIFLRLPSFASALVKNGKFFFRKSRSFFTFPSHVACITQHHSLHNNKRCQSQKIPNKGISFTRSAFSKAFI